jgi:D-glycero-D-manno-heptose 1,7-bisphosphate phosphatase
MWWHSKPAASPSIQSKSAVADFDHFVEWPKPAYTRFRLGEGQVRAKGGPASGLLQRPAVFLDRDGTLNHDTGYVYRSTDFRWLPGAVNAIRRLNDSGYYVFIVTNQSGVARGLYDETAIRDLHEWMNEELRAAGARIDDMRYCPHHPQASIAAYRTTCSCRKPAAGMLLDLMNVWPVIREASIMIGDKESDAAAGRAAGIAAAIVPAGELEGFIEQLLRRREAAWPSPGERPPPP